MVIPEIVLGPPGTGKTTTLLGMVDEELQRGVAPDRIGYMSFTRRAAKEAVDRACKKFGLEPKSLPFFRTLHSTCFHLLGVSSSDVLEKQRLIEFGEWAKVRVSGFVSMDEGSTFGSELGDRILFMENLARVRMIPLRQLYDEDDDSLDWTEVQRVVRDLEAYKKARHLIDYTDMLSLVVKGSAPPPLEVLFVDEAQDLSALQWAVVKKFASGVRRLVVAGDDDQAIYRWAGADVDAFVGMEGRVRVLDQSWRVPRAVQRVAADIVGRVSRRREKEWTAREAEGEVQRVLQAGDADLSGNILILARNTYLLRAQVEPILKAEGALYEFRGWSSVRPSVLQAIVAWEALRKGEQVRVDEVAGVYDLMESGTGVKRGFKKLPGLDPEAMVGMKDLVERAGLLTDKIWHEAMSRMEGEEKRYLIRALRKGEKLRATPRVRLSTIHGAKGGEADHVVLVTDMAMRTWTEAQAHPDDEARVFYVAATRAKNKLTIVAPRTSRAYEI